MPKPSTHEALIYLMVITSASDREMTDVELARIGVVTRSWPIFEDFNEDDLIPTAQTCQRLLQDKQGLDGVLALARSAIPTHLHDTAYAAAFEVATVDLEMRMEETARAATHAALPADRRRNRHSNRAGHKGAASHADVTRASIKADRKVSQVKLGECAFRRKALKGGVERRISVDRCPAIVAIANPEPK